MGLGIGSITGNYAIRKQIKFLEETKREKERFNGRKDAAERYLRRYKGLNRILAEIGVLKNAPRYYAAKEIISPPIKYI